MMRTALVTGAAGGMGTAISAALIEQGMRVVLVDRDEAALGALSGRLGGQSFALVLDVTDAPRVDRLPELLPEEFRAIDVLVNNAGHDVGGRKRFDVGSADDWADIVQTNLVGLMRVTRSLLPGMVSRNSGDIEHQRERLAAQLGRERTHRRLVAVDQHDPHAVLDERGGDRRSHATGGAGDQGGSCHLLPQTGGATASSGG